MEYEGEVCETDVNGMEKEMNVLVKEVGPNVTQELIRPFFYECYQFGARKVIFFLACPLPSPQI